MSPLFLALAATAVLGHGEGTKPSSIYDFKMNNIDNRPTSLKKYRGKVLLVVNVASKCGNTPQYAALESIFKKYRAQGFEVLGFPANNFGQQEPGTNGEIKQFCTSTYQVSFPMFSKISVKGDDESPLYKWLIASSDKPTEDIDWNFAKFIVGRNGQVLGRFPSRVKPDSAEVTLAIESALKN